eukprot:3895509-Amphidinium_carterae.1
MRRVRLESWVSWYDLEGLSQTIQHFMKSVATVVDSYESSVQQTSEIWGGATQDRSTHRKDCTMRQDHGQKKQREANR